MLEIRSVTVGYQDKIAIREVSLTVASGEILALVGPNGAGKTTLLRAISGILKIRTGGIRYHDQDLVLMSNVARARILAVVPQARQLGGAFTVAQTVMMGRTAHMNWLGKPQLADQAAVNQAMQQTSIEHLADRRNADLSGGEQQRVLLARALAQRTPILLLDEPTNHLDLQHQVNFLSLVRKLAQERALAVLMAMHDLNQVAMYADRVGLLSEGRLQALGSARDVLSVENVRSAYGVPVRVIEDPVTKTHLIFPDSRS
jgi:iron complex transport system ATP-binding protein